MSIRLKTSYHPYLLIAFHLNCLPEEWLEHIPRSTRHQWKQKDVSAQFGYDWYVQNRHLFRTLEQVASNKKLLRVNKALVQLIVLKRFIQRYQYRVKENRADTKRVVLTRIQKAAGIISLKTTLKCLQLPYSWYLNLRQQRCPASVLDLCYIRHPSQLLKKEVAIIESYCTDRRFIHWPRASVYHQIIRDKAAAFTISTFYKYVTLRGLQCINADKRRKNHHIGIRAQAPLKILHADTTQVTTIDNGKYSVYLVQDNFSRAILQHNTAKERKAQITSDNLEKVYENYLKPAGIGDCELITDDGSENHGPVTDWVRSSFSPVIRHLIAQRDIVFSNSMIEAANKQLKYRFLYHQQLADFDALVKYVQLAVDDYNNRPHNALNGLTPLEVLHGKTIDTIARQQQMAAAKTTRLSENKKIKCCHYSF